MTSIGWLFLIIGIIFLIVLYSRSRNNVKPSETKVRQQWLQQAERDGYGHAFDHPVCDICSKPLNLTESYNLTTEQVATKEAYWNYIYMHLPVHAQDSDGDTISTLATRMAGQSTAWGICESCSQMFQFDREAARKYGQLAMNQIPGSGPADLNRVMLAAAKAWKKLYGSYPRSIQVE